MYISNIQNIQLNIIFRLQLFFLFNTPTQYKLFCIRKNVVSPRKKQNLYQMFVNIINNIESHNGSDMFIDSMVPLRFYFSQQILQSVLFSLFPAIGDINLQEQYIVDIKRNILQSTSAIEIC